MLLGTLGTNLLENLLKGKGVKQSKLSNIPWLGLIRAGEEKIRAGEGTN